MNKVNRGTFLDITFQRNLGSLKVGIFLLAGVFLLSGCNTRNGNVLFDSSIVQREEQTTADNLEHWEKESGQDGGEKLQEQMSEDTGTEISRNDKPEETPAETCYVYVCGAIVNPGVYEVDEGTRVCEVIQYAGGLTGEAETTCMNQALAVYDGLMLVIPTVTQWENGEFCLDEQGFLVQVPKSDGGASKSQKEPLDDGKININEATLEQLCTLPGVGESRAVSIIAYREEHGAFETIEDIKQVSGIKEGLFEKIKEKIKV